MKITLASSAAGTVGSLYSPIGGALAGGITAFVYTYNSDGATWGEVWNNTLIGAGSGAEGGLIVQGIENFAKSALERVLYSGSYQGSIDAIGLGAHPIFSPSQTGPDCIVINNQCQ